MRDNSLLYIAFEITLILSVSRVSVDREKTQIDGRLMLADTVAD